MSAKFLRREAAKKCPVHIAVCDKAVEHLAAFGAFSREEVLTQTSMHAMADSIRWDYIKEFLEEEQHCELLPVSALFFQSPHCKQRKESPLDIKPEKYLASGHGKRTAGYASVAPDEHAKLVIKRLEQRRLLTNGVGKAFVAFVEAVENKGSTEARLEAVKQQGGTVKRIKAAIK